jgi:hypothetical protein
MVGSRDAPITASSLGILKSLEPFRTTTLGDDLARLSRFFGIKPTSETMARLTGTNPSTLSRAARNRAGSVRSAEHIAVLAAFAIDLEKSLESSGGTESESMKRWLLSGKMHTPDGPRIPIDVLCDRGMAVAALAEVRAARQRR